MRGLGKAVLNLGVPFLNVRVDYCGWNYLPGNVRMATGSACGRRPSQLSLELLEQIKANADVEKGRTAPGRYCPTACSSN